MSKQKFSLDFECVQSNKTKTGSMIIFAVTPEKSEKGFTARTAASFVLPEPSIANDFDPNKRYTITITETVYDVETKDE